MAIRNEKQASSIVDKIISIPPGQTSTIINTQQNEFSSSDNEAFTCSPPIVDINSSLTNELDREEGVLSSGHIDADLDDLLIKTITGIYDI